MKIKEVSAGVKISMNYNSYSMNLVADLDSGESEEKVGGILIEKAEKIISKVLGEKKGDDRNGRSKKKEVGAAWFSKNSMDKLSVQYVRDGRWEDVNIGDLKKDGDDYRRETKNGTFVFRRISGEKRKNNRMPVFRIYKIKEDLK